MGCGLSKYLCSCCGLSEYLCSCRGGAQPASDNISLVAPGAPVNHTTGPVTSGPERTTEIATGNHPFDQPVPEPSSDATPSSVGVPIDQIENDGEHRLDGKDHQTTLDQASIKARPSNGGDGGNRAQPDEEDDGYDSDDSKFSVDSIERSRWDGEDDEKDADFLRLRKKCGRFRILVIGKANAGKTTILQKMCNTTEAPIIRNRHGKEINKSVVRPTDGRGIHNINQRLTFSSNRAFVFHDSPGFESGSVKELEDVRKFISKRTASNQLRHRIHAIWYCLPTDNDRPLSDAEISFFEQGTGKTPVIAIFTKYDGMILKEYNRLRFVEKIGKPEALELAPVAADKLFSESQYYIKRVLGAPHPPTRWLRVQDLHKSENSCAELSRQTLEALDNKILQQLFVSVQQTNIGLTTEWIIKNPVSEALRRTHQDVFLDIAEKMIKQIEISYAHLFYTEDYSDLRHLHLLRLHLLRRRRYADDRKMIQFLRDAIPTLAGQGSVFVQIWRLALGTFTTFTNIAVSLTLAAASLVAAEDALWLIKDGREKVEAFKLALDNYQEPPRHKAIVTEVDEKLGQVGVQDLFPEGEEEGEGCRMMQDMVKKFRVQV